MFVVKLFKENPDILSKYQKKFKYILIDEFQDTNSAQYAFVKVLASKKKRFCAVGDDDQSIYKFRGAEVGNIFNIERDFPKIKMIKLERNYRSTQSILDASNSVISKNPKRREKKLWTEKADGGKVSQYWFGNELDEAIYIAKSIKEMYLKGKYSYNDISIFYRVNVQSRAIEEALKAERIPYKVVGSVSFYDKKEVKDTLAYVRLCINPHDNVSLRRVINYPARGIGAATLTKIETEAKKNDKSLYVAIKDICKSKGVSVSVKDKLEGFIRIIDGVREKEFGSADEMMKDIIEKVGYLDSLDDRKVQNIYEIVASGENVTIEEFMDRISLITNLDDSNERNAVSLMTMHTAKGLEFPVVYILGIEEGILPYFKADNNPDELHEERRLFYVGMTRAKEMLYLSGSAKRRLYSKVQSQEPSRFLSEIPADCCRKISKCKSNGLDKKSVKKVMKVPLSSPYKTGCRVKHPKWGVGVVRDCYGEGDDQKVMVNFPDVGIKRLALKFAHLERI